MPGKTTLSTLLKLKQQGQGIAMLTCYDASTAALLQQAGIDMLLVGDSLAQLILGHNTTLPATMDIMLAFSAAVRRGAPDAYIVADMPFLSYQVGREAAITNAGRFLAQAGCDAVKVELDPRRIELVADLTSAGIPVMAHLGYRPQSAGQQDKIVAARAVDQACQLVQDAAAAVQAGASFLLLECVTSEVAQAITQRTAVPVISCGSGPGCDGQVLVLHDVMGLPGATASKFSRRYADLAEQMDQAARKYLSDIRERRFPDDAHSYHLTGDDRQLFQQKLRDLP